MTVRTLLLAAITIVALASACGDSATPSPGIDPPSTFRLVVSPVRDPEEKAEVELRQIEHIAIVAIRPPEGPIELRMEDSADPKLSVANLTGEEILVSLFRDEHLLTEVPLPNGDTWYVDDGQYSTERVPNPFQ